MLRLFDSGDYPKEAIARDQSGEVELTLLIDEAGKVADCTVEKTSGVPTLDAQSCFVITKNGKLTPATDQNGKAAKDVFVQRIRWISGR